MCFQTSQIVVKLILILYLNVRLFFHNRHHDPHLRLNNYNLNHPLVNPIITEKVNDAIRLVRHDVT
jgi:hypothetical protein